MEKLDIAIAVAGAVVLVIAITGSAFYGGTSGGTPFAVTFPTSETDLAAQAFNVQGSGEAEATFEVAALNVTSVTFTAAASGPGAAGGVTFRLTATAPDGRTFEADGATLTAQLAEPPAPTEVLAASASAVPLPEPVANGTGTWTVLVQASGATPVLVPFTVTVGGAAEHYAAAVASARPPAR